MRKKSIIFLAVVTLAIIVYISVITYNAIRTAPDTEKNTRYVLSQPLTERCLENLSITQYRYVYSGKHKTFIVVKYDEDFNLHTTLTTEDKEVLLNWLVQNQ